MATGRIINVYGMGFSPEELAERATWHETTWIECEIPKALKEELSKIVSKKIKQFERKCKCGLCKLHNR